MAYKVIVRKDIHNGDALWEPGCPLEVEAIQVSRNTDTGEAFLQLKLKNVSDKLVESYKASAEVIHSEGPATQLDLHPLDADIKPGETSKPKAVKLEKGDVLDVRLVVSQVQSGTEVWTSGKGPEPLKDPSPFEASTELARERERLFRDRDSNTHPYLAEDHGAWWRCSCGQVNVGRDKCCSCHREASLIMEADGPSYLARSLKDHREQMEVAAKEQARKQRELEEARAQEELKKVQERKESNRLLLRRLAVVGVVAVILAGVLFAVSSYAEKKREEEMAASPVHYMFYNSLDLSTNATAASAPDPSTSVIAYKRPVLVITRRPEAVEDSVEYKIQVEVKRKGQWVKSPINTNEIKAGSDRRAITLEAPTEFDEEYKVTLFDKTAGKMIWSITVPVETDSKD